jgi:hypothetical protein
MITLSDVTLQGGLVWTDKWGSQSVSQQVIRTLGGLPVLYHAKLYAGVKVTLESMEDQGFQTLETVTKLFQLASVAGAQYLLNLDGTQFSVVFYHAEPPAFSAEPIIGRTTEIAGDYFRIKMNLLTI